MIFFNFYNAKRPVYLFFLKKQVGSLFMGSFNDGTSEMSEIFSGTLKSTVFKRDFDPKATHFSSPLHFQLDKVKNFLK